MKIEFNARWYRGSIQMSLNPCSNGTLTNPTFITLYQYAKERDDPNVLLHIVFC